MKSQRLKKQRLLKTWTNGEKRLTICRSLQKEEAVVKKFFSTSHRVESTESVIGNLKRYMLNTQSSSCARDLK